MTSSAQSPNVAMRIQPTRRLGILIVAIYGLIYTGIAALLDVDYVHVGDTTSNLIRGIVIPVGIGGVLLTILSRWAGWWQLIWRRTDRIMPRWAWFVPVALVTISVLRGFDVGWSKFSATYVLVLAVGVLLVGFSEEVLARGVLVLAARTSGASEFGVLIYSSAVFGLMHAVNAANGQSLSDTAVQVAFTALVGSWLYITLRVTGILLVPILVHALWDFVLIPPVPDDAIARFWRVTGVLSALSELALVVALLWAWKQRTASSSVVQ